MRKLNKFTALTLAATLMAGNVIAVSAAGDTQTSSATITYQSPDDNGGGTDPKNPEEPGETVEPDDEDENKDSTGSLTIDYISNFRFGTQDITSQDRDYYAATRTAKYYPDKENDPDNFETRELPNYVQVSDLRGVETGWTLSVNMSKFTVSDDQHDKYGAELEGAKITLMNLEATTEAQSGSVNIGGESLTLNPEADVTVMYAKPDAVAPLSDSAGTGTHMTMFGRTQQGDNGDESVMLSIPGKATKYNTSYEATLTWTLKDVPPQ